MTIRPAFVLVILLVFGFLSASTVYFYNKSRTNTAVRQKSAAVTFNGTIPTGQTNTDLDKKISELTKPAEPKGRLTFPEHVYTVQPKETLFAIGQKFGLPWQLIVEANGLTNENVVQADYPLVIPILEHSSDYYRVTFTLNEGRATELNQELRDTASNEHFDPVNVAKKSAVPYFTVSTDDNFTLKEQNLSTGTAAVEVTTGGQRKAVVGLYQPKVKGEKGFWALLYVEKQGK